MNERMNEWINDVHEYLSRAMISAPTIQPVAAVPGMQMLRRGRLAQ